MGREGIEKQIMPESFQNQERAFDEGVVAGQVGVIPNTLALQGGRVHDHSGDYQNNNPEPISGEIAD